MNYQSLYNHAHAIRDEFAEIQPTAHQRPLYVITADMVSTLRALCSTYTATDNFPVPPPTEYGVVAFDVPLWIVLKGPDQADKDVPPDLLVEGLTWQPARATDAVYRMELDDEIGKVWGEFHPDPNARYSIEARCEITSKHAWPGDDLSGQRYAPLFTWAIMKHNHGHDCDCAECAAAAAIVAIAHRLTEAFFILLGQRVIVTDRRRCDTTRPSGHRRKGAPERETLRVLKFRRPSGHGHNENPTAVDWSHRWLVNGHWRNQYWPSLDRHVPTWISPYIKGPDDKPLVVREDLRVLER